MLSRRGRDGFRAESLNSLKQMVGERGKDRWRGRGGGGWKEHDRRKGGIDRKRRRERSKV